MQAVGPISVNHHISLDASGQFPIRRSLSSLSLSTQCEERKG